MVLTEDLEEAATKSVKMAEILKMAREAKLNVSLLWDYLIIKQFLILKYLSAWYKLWIIIID